jgi:hypothetical protein
VRKLLQGAAEATGVRSMQDRHLLFKGLPGVRSMQDRHLLFKGLPGAQWLNCPKKNDEMFSKIPAHLNTQGLRNDNMSEEQWQGNQERPKQEFTAAANPLNQETVLFSCTHPA